MEYLWRMEAYTEAGVVSRWTVRLRNMVTGESVHLSNFDDMAGAHDFERDINRICDPASMLSR